MKSAGRLLLPILVLAGVLAWVGPGAFVAGAASITPRGVLAATLLTGVSTLASVWRWRLVAERIGDPLPMTGSVANYYRSQFLNATLPLGILGDLHRGLAHAGPTPARGLRGVLWERGIGQVVAVGLGVTVILTLGPVSLRGLASQAVGVLIIALLIIGALLTAVLAARAGRLGRRRWVLVQEFRSIVADLRVVSALVLASAVAALGHLLVFVIAVHGVIGAVDPGTALALASAVLLAAAVPLNLAGWGPREGAAAWAFASIGAGASAGVQVATAYGVMALIATLPGALVILVTPLRLRRATPGLSR